MFRLSPDVAFRDLGGEAVIVDLAAGTYFGLNEVGTRVWQLVHEGHEESKIVDILTSEYEADRATIARDVARLLDDLRARHFIMSDSTDDRM